MLRSTRRVKRHAELLELLITYPNEGRLAVQELGVGTKTGPQLTHREEKQLIRTIKERVNGATDSR